MAYNNENSGFIGKNDRKEKETHPDIKGSAEIGGVQYWVSGWKNAKGYGLKFKPKEDRPSVGNQPNRQEKPFDDDEIPGF